MTHLQALQERVDKARLAAQLAAVELGFKYCEAGKNLAEALEDAHRLLTNQRECPMCGGTKTHTRHCMNRGTPIRSKEEANARSAG